jgi:hypothetical protein
MFILDKVDLQFRLMADKLFFTDNTDLDLSNFKSLFESNEFHYNYLLDRFHRSLEIFWDENFWIDRLDTLLSLNSKRLDSEVGQILLSRFKRMIDIRINPTPKIDSEFVQFNAWTKVRVARKEEIISIRDFFTNLVYTVKVGKLTNIIGHFIPHLFQNMEEYLCLLGKRVAESARSFEVLQQLEGQGITIDKAPLFKLSKNLLLKRALNKPNKRSLFVLMSDPAIMDHLKSEYSSNDRGRLIAIIKSCEHKDIEENHLRNVKNLLELDPSIADELFVIYANKLWARGTGNRGANVKKLVRLCKTFPIFSPKKALVYLSTTGKMADIKTLITAFPELKTLAPFI